MHLLEKGRARDLTIAYMNYTEVKVRRGGPWRPSESLWFTNFGSQMPFLQLFEKKYKNKMEYFAEFLCYLASIYKYGAKIWRVNTTDAKYTQRYKWNSALSPAT